MAPLIFDELSNEHTSHAEPNGKSSIHEKKIWPHKFFELQIAGKKTFKSQSILRVNSK